MGALALPFPLSFEESGIGAATGGAHHAFGPAASGHVLQAIIGIGEVNDGFLEGAWRFHG